jgi:hypothetical protein
LEVAAADPDPEADPEALEPVLVDEFGGLMALPLTPFKLGKIPLPPGPV